MRPLRTFIALAFVAVMGTSCAGAPPRFTSPSHGKRITVALWLDPKSGLPPAETLEGCNRWNEKDVHCVMARNRIEADITIIADDHPCGPIADQSTPIAFASPYRVISFRVDCYYDTGRASGFDREMYLSTMAHEVGHELGIWDHVPLSCDDKAKACRKDGTVCCGVAIMNPIYDPEVKYITPIDAIAFDHRATDYTVAPKSADGKPAPDICVMYDRR